MSHDRFDPCPQPGDRDTVDADATLDRREFLRLGYGTVAGTVVGSLAAPVLAADPTRGRQQGTPAPAVPAAPGAWPVLDIAPLAAIKEGAPVAFNYPDARSPALLVRLAEGARNGVGPGNSIVAYSTLCTHKGCPVQWKPERKLLICPCHWSSFDPAKSGQMVIGQGSEPLPQVRLRVVDGVVQAVGLDGLVYGRQTSVA